MFFDVIDVEYVKKYELKLIFENRKSGIVNLQNYINKGGVFKRFSNIEYFKKFYINKELGTVCWPDDLDIAPETLYNEAIGEPLPVWMMPETEKNKKELIKNGKFIGSKEVK